MYEVFRLPEKKSNQKKRIPIPKEPERRMYRLYACPKKNRRSNSQMEKQKTAPAGELGIEDYYEYRIDEKIRQGSNVGGKKKAPFLQHEMNM
ncbi:MAG TPA: hypothetical protein VI546_06015 [candidate division Zixibacteria bacterium]|nr:hypothetical protein [candidate division Zixibacteria bacterium]